MLTSLYTLCGSFDTSARKYLRDIYGRARENSGGDMGVGQPDIQNTWSTPQAPNMRLSVVCASKDAQVQRGMLLSDFTRNLVMVGSLILTQTSRHTCRRGALIALLCRRLGLSESAPLLFCCFGCGPLLAFALSYNLSNSCLKLLSSYVRKVAMS